MTQDDYQKRIANNFRWHPPKGDQPARYERIRRMAMHFATEINATCPDSREKSLALTHLEQCMMWANSAIARNE